MLGNSREIVEFFSRYLGNEKFGKKDSRIIIFVSIMA